MLASARGRGAGVNRGRLVVFEGVDGSGKSTQLRLLAERLRARGVDSRTTHEPTDGTWGQRIRAMARSGERVAPEEELRWFVEDRREHVARVIEPALAAGQLVLSDRYYLSTVAYQGARGFDPQRLLADAEAEFPPPDLALVFEIDAARGLARVAERGGVAEPAFEEAAFLARVGAIFRAIERPWIARIAADAARDHVHAEVCAVLRLRLGIA
jgi:dTMP kinase